VNAATTTERLGKFTSSTRPAGPVNALDEGLRERTEGVLSEPFFSRGGSNVEAVQPSKVVMHVSASPVNADLTQYFH
jgi:hypothetical protein